MTVAVGATSPQGARVVTRRQMAPQVCLHEVHARFPLTAPKGVFQTELSTKHSRWKANRLGFVMGVYRGPGRPEIGCLDEVMCGAALYMNEATGPL